jgi:hypothetical protein
MHFQPETVHLGKCRLRTSDRSNPERVAQVCRSQYGSLRGMETILEPERTSPEGAKESSPARRDSVGAVFAPTLSRKCWENQRKIPSPGGATHFLSFPYGSFREREQILKPERTGPGTGVPTIRHSCLWWARQGEPQ